MVNGHSLGVQPVRSDVPQGSVLRPLLVLIHINDIFNIDLHHDSTHNYADDVVLFHTIHSPVDYVNLQQGIESGQT